MKPIKGRILKAQAMQWPTSKKEDANPDLFVLCVTGYINHVAMGNGIRTSFVLKTIESENGDRMIETRNSMYHIECSDIDWKVINDLMKDANLDVERMKS